MRVGWQIVNWLFMPTYALGTQQQSMQDNGSLPVMVWVSIGVIRDGANSNGAETMKTFVNQVD